MLGPAPPARALTGSLNEASSRPPVTAAVSSVQRGCSDTRAGSTSVAIAAIRHASIEHRSRATRPAPTADAAAMFRALADPERLRLLVRLAGDEANVSQLAGDQKLTTVSARLQFLLAARLVRRRREARQMFYAFADEHAIDRVANAMDHAGERYENAPPHRPQPRGPERWSAPILTTNTTTTCTAPAAAMSPTATTMVSSRSCPERGWRLP